MVNRASLFRGRLTVLRRKSRACRFFPGVLTRRLGSRFASTIVAIQATPARKVVALIPGLLPLDSSSSSQIPWDCKGTRLERQTSRRTGSPAL